MTRLAWKAGAFSAGVDRGVLYPAVGPAVPWNGLISVTENPLGEVESQYFDGVVRDQQSTNEEFGLNLEAFTYPAEFDGIFGLSYRTETDQGAEIHLVYNAVAHPTTKTHVTRSQEVDLSNFAWDISTRPQPIVGYKPSAHLVIYQQWATAAAFKALEDTVYGTDISEPFLPSIQEVNDLFEENAMLIITDNGDGTWTASGPDSIVYWNTAETFVINSPGVSYIDEDTYAVKTW